MSAKDITPAGEEEFDDFLLGQGDLANLLQRLPQPAPSAELDARILRDAEIALASEGANTPKTIAANDPAAQAGVRPPPGFLSRWRYPLGLVATLVLTVSVTLSVWRGQALQETPSVLIATEGKRANGPDSAAAASNTPAAETSKTEETAAATATATILADKKSKVTQQKPAAPVELAKPAATKETPQAWLERIEKLLKEGNRKEALEEWHQFQSTYPAYVMPAATLKELEALRGQK